MLQESDSTSILRFRALISKLHVLGNSYPPATVRNETAADGFEILGSGAECAVPAITRVFEQNLSPSSQGSAVFALAGIGRAAKNATPLLLRAATNGSSEVRWHALYGLAHIAGEDVAVPVLIHALGDTDINVQRQAVTGLAVFGAGAAPALPLLLGLATNLHSSLRLEAISAIGQIRASPETEIPTLIICMRDERSILRVASANSVARFTTNARAAIPALTDMLKDPEVPCQRAAEQALAQIRP
jgi:HEAT repeat protein